MSRTKINVTLADALVNAYANRPMFSAVVAQDGSGDYNGTTHAAIQSAIDAANTAGGGTVFIRAGTYTITTQLGSTSTSNINIVGEGRLTILDNTTASSGATDTLQVQDYCTIKDIYFKGNITDTNTNFSGDHINLDGSYNNVLNCWFSGGERCVRINTSSTFNSVTDCYGTNYVEHGVLCSNSADNNVIKGNRFDGGKRGVYLLDADHNIVECNQFLNHTARSIFVNRGSKFNAINANYVYNCTFIGISVENDTSASGEGPSEYNVVSNNVIKDCSSASIYVASDATAGIAHHNIIMGNVCYNGADGILIADYTANTVVSNNSIYSSGQSGIDVVGDYVSISGNTISSTTEQGIKLEASSDYCSVIGNNIISCGGTTYDGVRIDSTYNTVSGNQICGSGRHGIFVNEIGNTISGNNIHNSQNRGIDIQSTRCTVSGNAITNSGIGGDTEAIRSIQVGTVVSGNNCYDTQGTKTQTYGYAESGSGDYAIIVGNNFRTNKTGSTNSLGVNSIVGDNQ